MIKFYILVILAVFSLSSKAQKSLVLNENKADATFFIGLEKPFESFNYLQAAQRFHLPESGAKINKVTIQRLTIKLKHSKWGEDATDKTTFKLKVYESDSLTGGPGKQINLPPIEVKNNESKKIVVDLSQYNIKVPDRTFFVAVEWNVDKLNRRYHLGQPTRSISGKSERPLIAIYQPFLGMIYTGSTVSNVWVMTMEGKWKLYDHNMPEMTDLAMSVELAY